jgi:hypothetical protein
VSIEGWSIGKKLKQETKNNRQSTSIAAFQVARDLQMPKALTATAI